MGGTIYAFFTVEQPFITAVGSTAAQDLFNFAPVGILSIENESQTDYFRVHGGEIINTPNSPDTYSFALTLTPSSAPIVMNA